MTLNTYAHVIVDLEGVERVSAEAAICAAREQKCPESVRLARPA
jgi:endonuclease V-like protein UPF0215 family